jgi:hypothetical protein
MQVYVITERFPITECMKYAALSANIATEEPIDVALFNSYPDAVGGGPTYSIRWVALFNSYTNAVGGCLRAL